MKALRFLLAAVVLVVAGFFAIGILVPEFSYETTILVDRPVGKAWAVFTDTDRMGEWLEGFRSIETVRGKPGEVGSVYRMTFEERGRPVVFTETVTAYQEEVRFAFTLDHDIMEQDVEVLFEPRLGRAGNGDGCTIRQRTTVRGKGLAWRSLLPLMRTGMTGHAMESYRKLREIIEAEG